MKLSRPFRRWWRNNPEDRPVAVIALCAVVVLGVAIVGYVLR